MIHLKTRDITRPLMDNEYSFLEFIRIFLEHADSAANFELKRNSTGYIIIITPSKEEFKEDIIKDIIEAHRRLGLKVTFSKSLAKEKRISFGISL